MIFIQILECFLSVCHLKLGDRKYAICWKKWYPTPNMGDPIYIVMQMEYFYTVQYYVYLVLRTSFTPCLNYFYLSPRELHGLLKNKQLLVYSQPVSLKTCFYVVLLSASSMTINGGIPNCFNKLYSYLNSCLLHKQFPCISPNRWHSQDKFNIVMINIIFIFAIHFIQKFFFNMNHWNDKYIQSFHRFATDVLNLQISMDFL